MPISKNILVFFIKLIALLSLVVFVCALFVLPYAPDIGEDLRYLNSLEKLKHKEYDMIFFGNSYMFIAYDPITIKEKLDADALHVNVGAQRLEASVIIANEILDTNNVEYIFFDISGPSLDTPKLDADDIWQYQTKGLQEIEPSFAKIKKVFNFYPVAIYPEYTLTAISKKAGRLFRANNRLNYSSKEESVYKKSWTKKVHFAINGFIANKQNSIDKSTFSKSFFVEPTPELSYKLDNRWSQNLCKSMGELLKRTEKENIKVILINSLKLYSSNYKSDVINDFTDKYNHVRFLDLNANKSSYKLDETSFYNSTHLNYSGSVQVTQRLVDSLSYWYDIPFRKQKPHSFENLTL